MMKVFGTGLKGLVGSRIVELLQDKVEFEFAKGDISDQSSINQEILSSDAPFVLHLAAKTNVDECEKEKALGENSSVWKTNVFGTQYIAKACSRSGKKLIYISTDFVFDGENPPYDESSAPNPVDWYAVTKLAGEEAVQSVDDWIIGRISNPYRATFVKNDFVRAMIDRFKKGEDVQAVEDHIFTPTFIDDIAVALLTLMQKNEKGIFHIVGSESLSPVEAALLIAEKFNFDKSLVKKTTREEFFKDRAKRPFRLVVKNDKITQLGVAMSSFSQGLDRIKEQL